MEKIIIVNAVYPPEPVVSAQIGRDLASYLARRGSDVTVLCPFPTRPMGATYAAFSSNGYPVKSREDGVNVVRLPSFTAPESRIIGRMRESLSFGWRAGRFIRNHIKDANVVYANVWPLLGQAAIAHTCSQLDVPLVLHVQDIYPEALVSKLPGIFGAAVTFPLKLLDKWTARKASALVVISRDMGRVYTEDRGVGVNKIAEIPNWQNEELFENMPLRDVACGRYGIENNKFTFLYMGNIGPVAGVELLIESFHKSGLKDSQLVIAGDGSSKGACVEYARALSVGNVRFISDPEVRNVPVMQSLAHVCLLPAKKGAGTSSIPSKLMAYLFSAKPVLASIDTASDTARCLREARCGWVGAPDDADWLSAKMTEIASMKHDILQKMGAEGRAYGLLHFSKSKGVEKLGAVVLEAARRAK